MFHFAFLCIAIIGGSPSAFANLFDKARESTVYIFYDATDTKTGAKTKVQGTGVIVSPEGHVLTASHLFRYWNKQDEEQNPIMASLGDKPDQVSTNSLKLDDIDLGNPDSQDVALLK